MELYCDAVNPQVRIMQVRKNSDYRNQNARREIFFHRNTTPFSFLSRNFCARWNYDNDDIWEMHSMLWVDFLCFVFFLGRKIAYLVFRVQENRNFINFKFHGYNKQTKKVKVSWRTKKRWWLYYITLVMEHSVRHLTSVIILLLSKH